MKLTSVSRLVFGALMAIGVATTAVAGEQEAIDGCIDRLRAVGGPDAKGGG